jgi:metacaspase-1
MTARAVCVGINDYPVPGADLKGCVNDARQWAGLLKDHYGFSGGDIRLLLDREASKAQIISALKGLLANARSGDVLVFTNSSHGTYVEDTSGDEERYDEALCPWDIKDNLIVDDDLRGLFSDLPRGVRLTVISDSCFSGTVTRAALAENIPGLSFPDRRRVRFLNPALIGRGIISNPIGTAPRGRLAYPQRSMSHLLLTGCNDREYSYDAKIGSSFHGAMTYHAIKAITDAGFKLTYAELARRLQPMLDAAGYWQHPQLEGKSAYKRRSLFT